jgi:hypothetical protein
MTDHTRRTRTLERELGTCSAAGELEDCRTTRKPCIDTDDHMSVSRDLQRGYGRFHDSANFVLVEMLVHTLLRLDQIRPYKLSLH